jgi:GTPase SAR1 family protein
MKITKGVRKKAQRVCLYGVESVGKTTFASKFPSPLFLDIEQGTSHLDITRAEIANWKDLLAAITEAKAMEFETIVIDSIDWAERLCIEDLLATNKKSSIEDFGFGKGWVMVAEKMSRLLTTLDEVIDANKNVVLIAHSQIKRFEAPDAIASYDRYELKLSKQSSPLVKEWADELWFMRFKTKVTTSETGKGKAVGGKDRIILTTHSAAYDAKTRSGLPDELAMEWSGVAHLFQQKEEEKPTLLIPVAENKTDATQILEDNEAYVNGFLQSKGNIQKNQTWRDCDAAYLNKIYSKIEDFMVAVEKWKGLQK